MKSDHAGGTAPCARCGQPCDGTALIMDRPYCHNEIGATCYMRASWNLFGAAASVGIEHGMTTSEVLESLRSGSGA